MPTLSTPELTRLSATLARALSIEEVNQVGRDTGQAVRLRTVTPHRLFLAMVSTLGSGRVESLADLRVPVVPGTRLSRLLRRHAEHVVDLDVAFVRDDHRVRCRLVALPGREPAMTRLCTNLPRTPFAAALVGRLYRFRWQIELYFKEYKSYANLHQFDTANPHIAAGLIWASLCAAVLKRFLARAAQRVGAGPAISTRRVAMCAHHFLDDLVAALLGGRGLVATLRRALGHGGLSDHL